MDHNGHSPSGTVLIVDDEPAARALFRHTLQTGGFTVLEAEDHRGCMPILEDAGAIDAVLLDLILPELSGIDILKLIREMPDPPPVVMATSSSVVQDAVTALKLGAFDYLVKPGDTNNQPKFIGVMTNAVNFGRA